MTAFKEIVYLLGDAEAERRLRNHLMQRSAEWSVSGPAIVKYPVHVFVRENYDIRHSMLVPQVRVDGIFYDEDVPIKRVLDKRTTTVNVVAA